MIWFIAGINGTGKSTLCSSPAVQGALGVSVINPDEVARAIAADTGIDYALANLAAAEITEGEVFQAAARGTRSIAIETVLSSDKFYPVLDIAHKRGIQVGMIYVALRSVELSLKRIETRVEAGLHNVPEERVRERWTKTHENLRKWAPRVDRLVVFSNNDADRPPILVAQKFSKLAAIEIYDRNEVPLVIKMLDAGVR
jgi:predicted ABC-type ATPase